MRFNRVSPVFPVSDLRRAMAHYARLGFEVRAFAGTAHYAYASADGLEIHLTEVQKLRPRRNLSAIYVHVDDADALFARWRDAGAGDEGGLIEPRDTAYGLREGACVDEDGNLIRFGSPLARRD